MTKEVWKLYKITNNNKWGLRVYFVSNYGNVLMNGHPYICNIDTGGYKILGTSNELLHRIVAELFIPNPDNKPEVDHIDADRQNNNVNNLHWVTRKENHNNINFINKRSKISKEFVKTINRDEKGRFC